MSATPKPRALSREIMSFENDDEIIGLNRLFQADRHSASFNQELAFAQTTELVRLLPISAASSLISASFAAWCLAGSVNTFHLVLWVILIVAYASFRYMRATWLLRHSDQIRRIARRPWRLALGSIVAALIYLVPGLMWSMHGDENVRLTFCILLTGMMWGGSTTLASVPPAAMAYVWTVALGVAAIYGIMGSPALAVLFLSLTLSINATSLGAWRRFNDHFRAISRSREKSRIIELLRELGASGSNWLWETDAETRIVSMSDAMVAAIGGGNGNPVGKFAREVLDPYGQAASMSSGMKSLL